ncbi:MAG: RagB/SusD family nutrient uptake outer membrane protein, partial [Chitinophagaceae bacterium]
MKTKYIKSLSKVLLVSLALSSASCNKFLEEEDPSNLTPETFFTIPGHADGSLAAAYAQTRFIGNGAGIFAQNWSLPEMLSGTARTETGQNSDLNNLIGLAYNGDNLFVTQWWNGLYSVVAQANLSLQKIPTIPGLDEPTLNRAVAQAKFLRAWAYFYIVRMWGDAPLITSPVDATTNPDLYAARTAQAAIYDQIVKDLTEAETGGLPMTDNTGRASLGAVKGLLAKVYLTMAGFPLSKGATHYQLAADKAKEVIDGGGYSLFTNYNDLHNLATKNRTEFIFSIQYLGGVADNPIQSALLPNLKGISSFGTEVGSNTPVPGFVATYDPSDLRLVDRQGFYYTSYYDEGFGPLKPLGNPYVFKHFDVICHGTLGVPGTSVSSMNLMNLRYPDVLLIYAEASNEVSAAPSQTAVDAVALIRTRAGLTTPGAGTFSQATFRD